MGTDVVKNVNKNNASHAVLFEALSLVSLSDSWGKIYQCTCLFPSPSYLLNFPSKHITQNRMLMCALMIQNIVFGFAGKALVFELLAVNCTLFLVWSFSCL